MTFFSKKAQETSTDSQWGLGNPGLPRFAICIREPTLHLTNLQQDWGEHKSEFFLKGREVLSSRSRLAGLGLVSKSGFTQGFSHREVKRPPLWLQRWKICYAFSPWNFKSVFFNRTFCWTDYMIRFSLKRLDSDNLSNLTEWDMLSSLGSVWFLMLMKVNFIW